MLLLILIVVIVLVSIKQISEYERGIKFTCGKFSKIMNPGWNLVFPIFQSYSKIDIRTKVIDVPEQEVITKDNVSVKEFETDEENTTLIQVLVDSEDIGRVIGKQKRMINSIRTLVQASSSLQDKGRVRIEVDSF